jgi:serine/threonine protein kinase
MNILITREKIVKIADLGVSKALNDGKDLKPS